MEQPLDEWWTESSPCTWGLTEVKMSILNDLREFPMYVGINRNERKRRV